MIQILVYSLATGRHRGTYDPEADVPNVLAYLDQVPAKAGEGKIVYTKQVPGPNDLPQWQAALNAHTGLDPDTAKTDWYVCVDASNNIVMGGHADPACGDFAPAGLTMVSAPWGAQSTWKYDGTTFTPPAIGPKPTAV